MQLITETTWGNPHQLPHMGDPILGYCNCTSGQGCIFKAKLKSSKSGIRILWHKLTLAALSGLCKPIRISSLDLLLIVNIHQQPLTSICIFKNKHKFNAGSRIYAVFLLLFCFSRVLRLGMHLPFTFALAYQSFYVFFSHRGLYAKKYAFRILNYPNSNLRAEWLFHEQSFMFVREQKHSCVEAGCLKGSHLHSGKGSSNYVYS